MRRSRRNAREKPVGTGFDLALVNPPFHHRGPEVDLGPALALFDSLAGWLTRSGRALVVANRTLPWETPLARLGEVTEVSRVYVFDARLDPDGEWRCSQRYEHCAQGIKPEIDNPDLQEADLAEMGFARWVSELRAAFRCRSLPRAASTVCSTMR